MGLRGDDNGTFGNPQPFADKGAHGLDEKGVVLVKLDKVLAAGGVSPVWAWREEKIRSRFKRRQSSWVRIQAHRFDQ